MQYWKHIRPFMRRVTKLAITTCDIVTFRKAAYRVSAFYDAQLAPSGLCMPQFSALVRLHREKRVRFEAFFENSTMEKSAVSRNLRHLTEAGLIRIGKPGAGSRGIVTLTRRGLAVLRKAVPLWQVAQTRFEALNGALLRETLNGLVLEG
jgi:DNA-binding MarR family transcriptional regulator